LNRWEQNGQDDFYQTEGYDGPVFYYQNDELSSEELANRGKYLLPTPPPPVEYFQAPMHKPVYPDGNQFGPPYGPGPGHHEAHPPHQYYEEHWQEQPEIPYGQPASYQQHPYQTGPPMPYPPGPAFGPPVVALTDPRQHRALSNDMMRSPPGDIGPSLPEPPMSLGGSGGTQTLEAVMQQLAKKLSSTVSRAVVDAPEFDAALSRNNDPPLYRLEPIHIPKTTGRGIFERLVVFRTVEELGKDPRVALMMKTLAPVEADKTKVAGNATTTPKLDLIPAEPVEPSDPKKASQEFDAFTAMLNRALESTKKREAEEEAGRTSPGKRPRRVATATQ
jgi:hypothetical protein